MFTLAACECNDVQPEGAKRGKSNLCVLAINLFSQCQAMPLRAQQHPPVLTGIPSLIIDKIQEIL